MDFYSPILRKTCYNTLNISILDKIFPQSSFKCYVTYGGMAKQQVYNSKKIRGDFFPVGIVVRERERERERVYLLEKTHSITKQ